MSLHVAAKHLASKGRDGDTELVHMTKGEIKGLQGLALAHGGSLSINPDTGLIEASFLKKILPMVAGAALSPFITPMGAAALVGGIETARTGDIGKGLMAGLGAYGGAGLTSGLSQAGASATAEGAVSTGADTMTSGAGGFSEYQQALGSAPQTAAPAEWMAQQPTMSTADAMKTIGSSGTVPSQAPVTMGNVGSGIGQLGSEAGRSAVYNALPTGTLPALGGTVANAMTPEMEPPPGMPEEEERYKGSPYRYNLSSSFGGSTPVRPSPYYRPAGLGYAAGGLAGYAGGGAFDDEGMGDDVGMAVGGLSSYAAGGTLEMKKMSLGDGIYRDTDDDTASLGAYDAAKKRMEKQYGAANLKAPVMPKSGVAKLGEMKAMASGGLGSYSDGGRMLKGPGDGMSDSIPAVIGKKQPARLADGEFVVPADVVSHLGNGSTDAGAKKLYSMMDKVRQARTGKKKQAPAVKTDKYLPA